jgi:hypothetical protein
MAASVVDVYEVRAKGPGEGIDLASSLRPDRVTARDRLGASRLSPGDVIVARLLHLDDRVEVAHAHGVPSELKDALLHAFALRAGGGTPSLVSTEVLKVHGAGLLGDLVRLRRAAASQAPGEAREAAPPHLSILRASYRVVDRAALLDRLGRAPGIAPEPEPEPESPEGKRRKDVLSFAILRSDGATAAAAAQSPEAAAPEVVSSSGTPIDGFVAVKQRVVALEAVGREAFTRARAALERAAGEALAFKSEEVEAVPLPPPLPAP